MNLYRIVIVVMLALLVACVKNQEVAQDKSQYDSYMQIAERLSLANDKETAQFFYQRAQRSAPKAIEPRGKPVKITKKRQESLQKNKPSDLDATIALSSTYLAANQIEEAIFELKKLPSSRATRTQIDTGIGALLDRLGAHWSAKKCYQRGLRNDPTKVSLWNNIATSYFLSGQYEQSLQTLEKLGHFSKLSDRVKLQAQAIRQYLKSRPQLSDTMRIQARTLLVQEFAPQIRLSKNSRLSKVKINQLRAICT